MVDIPVGKDEKQEMQERAVEAFKGAKGKAKSREEIQSKAAKYLAEIRANLAKGLVYFTEDDTMIDSPEHVMALMLAGKNLEARAPVEEKPITVVKGPPIEGGT